MIHKTSKPQTNLPAITAHHNRLAEEVIYRLLVQLPARFTFSRVWLKIEGPLPHPADGPLIGYLNHPSWWDGYATFFLHREIFRRRFIPYLMMDERQLRAYRFFSWIGVFSVNLRDRAKTDQSTQYIARLLRERRDRCFWIFPQGKLTPNERRPLTIYPGTSRIAIQAGGATLWPVAVRYEFRYEQHAEMFIRAGPPHYAPAGSDEAILTTDIAQRLTTVVDTLRDEVAAEQLDDYRVLLQGRPGINQAADVVRALWARLVGTG
ncbi:MAG: lysophospholipid acyltransferase family protein [Chloroflexota bacterium]